MKNRAASFLYCTLLISAAAHADDATRYVRDWISVPLYETPNSESKVAHPGLSSGTTLTRVNGDDQNGYARVRTAEGVEGWIATRYLISEPTARMQLDRVNNELADLRQANETLKAQQGNIPQDQRVAAQQITELKSDNERLQTDLQTLQQAPDNATQLAQENVELKKDNETLRSQIDAHTTKLAELQRSNNYALFREGGIAVLAGALLTLLIANLWPKKKSEWF